MLALLPRHRPIQGLQSLPSTVWKWALSDLLVAINREATLLPNYYLNFTWVNTECSAKLALQQAVDFLSKQNQVTVGIIGGGWFVIRPPTN